MGPLSAVPGSLHSLPASSFTDGAPDVRTLSMQLLSKPSNECDQMAFNQRFGEQNAGSGKQDHAAWQDGTSLVGARPWAPSSLTKSNTMKKTLA